MKKLLFVMTTIITLASCKSFKGTLESTSKLTFNDKKNSVTVPAGTHSLKISFSSKRKGKFEVMGKKIKFKLAKNIKLPSEGEFCLKENQWDQSFEACGGIVNNTTYGPLRHDWESCTYQVARQVCEGGGRNRRCWTVYDTYNGQRLVEYRMKHTVEDLSLTLFDRGLDAGSYSARNNYHDKVYQHQGSCR
ncbi:MAG: hypothetical protein BM556_13110 [Bacteriovorax sp. MedPE-SWde]|nr:MAG: hypothetical protein BM556_13110 [Bacteriovorax sp. MedPE-SWde]